MSRKQAADAILYGMQMVGELKQQGYNLIATGEMGIGNTTTSSAILSVLLHRPITEMTGRGAGLSSAGLQRKIDAIARAIEVNRPDANDPLDVLHKVGGFDIAGLVGVFLGGAQPRSHRHRRRDFGSSRFHCHEILPSCGRLLAGSSCVQGACWKNRSGCAGQKADADLRDVSGRGHRRGRCLPGAGDGKRRLHPDEHLLGD